MLGHTLGAPEKSIRESRSRLAQLSSTPVTPVTPITPVALGHQKAKGQLAKPLKRVPSRSSGSLSSGSKFYTHVIMQRSRSEKFQVD